MFECDKCNKKFNFNSLLKKHQSRKRSCITIEDYHNKLKEITDKIENIINESLKINIKCLFCEKNFSNKSNLSKHIYKVCVVKNELDNEKNKILEYKKNQERNNEIKQLRIDMEKILKKQTTNITINNTINNNNNNLVININPYGKENLSHITDTDYKKYLNGFFSGFTKFIEKVHFDKHMPENHNICISNIKSKYVYVYEDNKWIMKHKNDILDNLITKKYNILTDKCDELEDDGIIDDNILENFRTFQENYDNTESQKNTKNDVMLLLYNNRDKVELN